jgi:cytochrome bd ubiquinol oxidase subunit II
MELSELWFGLIAILFIGFFFLEGFDYGVGILLPFLGKNDRERREVVNTIGPVWDANEVWLITAGGAMFAAFPHWYATLFSGFYLALFIILVALIFRGVAFEFRSKDKHPTWRKFWDWAIFFGSAVPALLWGVAFANIVRGVPIDADMHFTGNLLTLLNPYGLLGGLVTLTLFTLHGALFLELKTDGDIRRRVDGVLKAFVPTVIVLTLGFVLLSAIETTMFESINAVQIIALIGAVGGLLGTAYFSLKRRFGLAFVGSGLAIVFVTVLLFASLFPNVMPSSTDDAFSLTVYNASSSQYTLQIMTVVALIFVPVVLIYQGWTYWVFRHRVTSDAELEY